MVDSLQVNKYSFTEEEIKNINPKTAYNINVGVLGHIDSGKTSLSKALSVVTSTASMDKNPQSQERGITLDLGFSAFFTKTPERLNEQLKQEYLQFTLVDCPGHASLIKTIIGGASIIDIMFLVIDINKGIQTQTAECLVIGNQFSTSSSQKQKKIQIGENIFNFANKQIILEYQRFQFSIFEIKGNFQICQYIQLDLIKLTQKLVYLLNINGSKCSLLKPSQYNLNRENIYFNIIYQMKNFIKKYHQKILQTILISFIIFVAFLIYFFLQFINSFIKCQYQRNNNKSKTKNQINIAIFSKNNKNNVIRIKFAKNKDHRKYFDKVNQSFEIKKIKLNKKQIDLKQNIIQ